MKFEKFKTLFHTAIPNLDKRNYYHRIRSFYEAVNGKNLSQEEATRIMRSIRVGYVIGLRVESEREFIKNRNNIAERSTRPLEMWE